MLKKSLKKFIVPGVYTQPLLFIAPLILGISTPVTAQVDEGVNDFSSPQFNNNIDQSSESNQSYIDFDANPSTPDSQSFDRYMVYVDSNNFQTLEQVRQVEPTAFVRQFQRRYIIQAGVFSNPTNAQRRIRQLASYGVNNTRIFSPNQRREIPNDDAIGGGNQRVPRYYYVAIPSNAEDVTQIANRIQQETGFYRGINASNNGRGYYVAVGPFARRADARKWNNYLHDIGFGNARIHYGR